MNNFETEWKKVSDFVNQGKPQSAKAIVDNIYKAAKAAQNEEQIIKSKAWLIALNSDQEHSEIEGIKKAEAAIKEANSTIEKAIWHSITADLYWQYVQQNRYKLYDRTAVTTDKSDDIATWDIAAFYNKITAHYLASVKDKNALADIPTSRYQSLINKGKNTEKLRPTVYDVLVYKAIDFFKNDESSITKPAYAFSINNPAYLAPASTFMTTAIVNQDTASPQAKALALYQDLLQMHSKKGETEAFIDADIKRLEFVYDNIVLTDKKALYKAALQNLINTYPNNPSVAEAMYLLATLDYEESDHSDYDYIQRNEKPKTKVDLKKVEKDLMAIVAKFPKSEGGVYAQNTLLRLLRQSIKIDMEDVNIPNENIRAKLTYKNLNSVQCELYKISIIDFINRKDKFTNPVRQWNQTLINSSDLDFHSAEVKIDALPLGIYAIVINGVDKGKIKLVHYFQVSNLSAVKLDNNYRSRKETNEILVLNRKNGTPEKDVKIQIAKDGKIPSILQGSSDAKGKIQYGKIMQDYSYGANVLLSKGEDNLLLLDGDNYGLISYNDYNNYEERNSRRAFIFTDRSIYRPGQIIHFKGILLLSKNKQTENNVVQNENVTVTFYDVNNQKLKEQQLRTNSYGSFAGTFTAPESGLTGTMRIETQNGNVYFNVEEYKRPKFFVTFDTLKSNYALNDMITVKGNAKAYAGNNIDNATVKYRVVRRTRFPFWWLYYRWGRPSSEQMEITNGTVTTNTDGSFGVTFKAIPDESVNPETLPIYNYEVIADVTDINGETRSGSSTIAIGYRSLIINTSIPEQALASELKSISIKTENLNKVFTATPITVTISRLQSAEKLYRERLWTMPTDFIMSEAEFKAAFPNDMYKDEWKPENRALVKKVFEKSYTTTVDGKLNLDNAIWDKSAYYVIEISAKDKDGKAVTEKQYAYIYVPNDKQNELGLFVADFKNQYQPGDKMKMVLSPGYKNAYLFQENTWKKNFDWKTNEIIEQPITEADRGGANLAFMYVYNSRVYQANKFVNVPWLNKDLTITWATHRDKLLPNAAEEWTMTITGNNKEKVAAELVATLYDASLDALNPHNWQWSKLYDNIQESLSWRGYGFGYTDGSKEGEIGVYANFEKQYPYLLINNLNSNYGGGLNKRMYKHVALDAAATAEYAAAPSAKSLSEVVVMSVDKIAENNDKKSTTANTQTPAPPTIRTNLQETAFFMPQLQTDENGNIKIKFTIPEALTEWNLKAFAHTKDWKTGYLEGSIKTQKELMVMPNLPRFFRQGDNMTIAAKISNLSDKTLSGTARLEILNAATLQPLNLPFGFKENIKTFSVAPNQSTNTAFDIKVPLALFEPVIVRIVAVSGNFSDGEENMIPVITNRMLVTETLPLPVRGNSTESFTFEKLLNSKNSNTLLNKGLTVEFTGNPAWYAVQALPYLMEYPYECAEQTFNRFYANALAAHIVAQSPKVEAIFNKWKTIDTAALLSNLEKNQELKSALLEETPWVLEAKSEKEQKHRIAMLFETHKIAKELENSLKKLEQMQSDNGAFPWFIGMGYNRYITQYIATGIGKLQKLNVSAAKSARAKAIVQKALGYLDAEMQKDYDELKKEKMLDKSNVNYSATQYLYMRSFFADQPIVKLKTVAFDYFKAQSKKHWLSQNPYMQGMTAIAMNRYNEKQTANLIIESLTERAIVQKEMGMFWKNNVSYWWYDAPIETQAVLISAYQEITNNQKHIDDMKVWLLKQKQTQNWKSTTATADAVYALLLSGTDWLKNDPQVTITLGNTTISSTTEKTEAGTGYFKKQFAGDQVKPDMGNITVKVDNKSATNSGTSWGAVYWQYFENIDKISASQNGAPLAIEKKLFVETNSDRGPVLSEVKPGQTLKVGDKVKVRVILRVDRAMEYVHMKDMRAAGFEPVNVLSGYRFQGGLGYYESTKDVATHFFFDYLPKGTFVFEYPLNVSQKGNFSNGITTAQCMYAPEFSSHSESVRVEVK